MSWLSDKVQGVKDWFAPVGEKLGQAGEFIHGLLDTSADPIQADTETRKANEDFLSSKGIVFGGLLGDVTDFVKAIPGISAVTQTPMEKVELYGQRFSPIYKNFKDNIETIQALVNQGKMDYNLGIETIKGEVDKLQNNSNAMSKEIGLTNQDLKINDIETLIDIGVKGKASKDQAILGAGKKFETISAKLFGGDPEKAAKTKSSFVDEWTAATEESVKKVVTDISEGKRAYDGEALNGDYFLGNNIPKLRDYGAEQYSILQTQEDRAQKVIDEAKAAGKDTTAAEAKKSAIVKIKNDYKDNIIKFSNYYLDNIGTEKNTDMQDFFDTYKEETGTDMDELLGIKKNGLINNYETSAQLLVDQIDRDMRPTENKRLYDAGGPMQKIDVTVAAAAGRLNKYIAEGLSEKIGETINKVTGGDYVSDPFSRSDNTRMKNFLFSFSKESEPGFIEKTGRTLQQIGPELGMLRVEMRGFGKLKSAGGKGINKVLGLGAEALKGLGYFDEYEDLIRGTKAVEGVAGKLTGLGRLVGAEKTVAINNAIKFMPSNLMPITKDIISGMFSAVAEGPALSGLFDQFNPQGYQQGDAVLDMVFMGLDTLVDSAKAFQYYSKPMSFQRMMQDPKFYDTYYQKLVGVSPQHFAEQSPQYRGFANLYAQRYLDTAVNSAKKMESINPKIIDRTIQTIKGTYSALAGKDMGTILKEKGTKIFDFIAGQTNETLSKKDLVKQQSKELLMPKLGIEEIAPGAKLGQVGYAMDKEGRKISSIHIDGSTPIFTGDKNADTLLHKLFHTQNYKKYYGGKTMAELEAIGAKIKDVDEKKKYMSGLKRASVYLDSEADTIKKLKDLGIDANAVVFDVWSKADIEKANIDPELLAIREINPDFDYLKISGILEKDIIANVYMNTADWVIRGGKTIENTDFQKLISALENIDRNMFPGMVNRQKMYEELVKLNNAGKFSTKWNMADIQKLVDKATTMRVIFDSQLAMASDGKAAAFLKRNSSDYIITNFIFKILDSGNKKMFDLAMGDEYQELFYNMVKGDEALLKLAFGDDVKIINSGDLSAMISSGLIDIKTARQIRDNRVRQFLNLPILNSTPYDNLVDAQSILAKALFVRLEKQFPNATDEVLQELARTVDTFFSTKNNDTFFKAIEKDKKISDAVKDTILKRIKGDEPKPVKTWLTKAEQEVRVTKNIRAGFIDKIQKSIGSDIIYDQKMFDDMLGTVAEADQFKKSGTTVYGFVKDGKIYLNPSVADEGTLFHEAPHLWYYMAKEQNADLISKINDMLRKTSYYQDLKDTVDYIKTDAQRLDEAFARVIELGFNKSGLPAGLVSQAKALLKQFYTAILKSLGIKSSFLMANPELLKDLTLKDIQNFVMGDLVSGKSLTDIELKNSVAYSTYTPDGKLVIEQPRDVRGTKTQLEKQFKQFAGTKGVDRDYYGNFSEGNVSFGTVFPVVPVRTSNNVAFSTGPVTSKFIEDIEKSTKKDMVSKEFIESWIARQGVYKAPDIQYAIETLKEFPENMVSKTAYIDSFKSKLLPLNKKDVTKYASYNGLRDEMGYDIDGSYTTIYESPFPTSVGNNHFGSETDNYFSHGRTEVIGDTNRIIEIQSDLFQRKRYLDEIISIEKLIANSQDRLDHVNTQIDIVSKIKKYLDDGEPTKAVDYMQENSGKLGYSTRTAEPREVNLALERLGREQLDYKNSVDVLTDMKNNKIDISLQGTAMAIAEQKRLISGYKSFIEKISALKNDPIITKKELLFSDPIASSLFRAYGVEKDMLDSGGFAASQELVKDAIDEKLRRATDSLSWSEKKLIDFGNVIKERDGIPAEVKNQHLENYKNSRYEREIREQFATAAEQGQKFIEYPDPHTIAKIEKYIGDANSGYGYIPTGLDIGDVHNTPEGEVTIIGWNGTSEAQVIPTRYLEKEFTYDDAYDDTLNYYYDSLEGNSYELGIMIDDMGDEELKAYKNYADDLKKEGKIPEELNIKDEKEVFDSEDLRQYVREQKEGDYVAKMIGYDFHDAESYVNYYNREAGRGDANLFYNPKTEMIEMYNKDINGYSEYLPIRDPLKKDEIDPNWRDELAEDQLAVVDFYKNKVLPYVEKTKKGLTEYVEKDGGRWLRVVVTPEDNKSVVAFSTSKQKLKADIVREKKVLEGPLTVQNPLVITKKFPGGVEAVPMKSVIGKSDEVIITIASSENTLLDYLLNQGKITVDEYKILVGSRYLDLGSDQNTLKQIEFLLAEKLYDSINYGEKSKIFAEAEKIVEQTDKITLLEKELDNYDTQLKQYNDTKTALEQSRENVESIKKSSFQIVGDLLPKLGKEYQTTLNTLRSKYRMGENVSLHSALKKITDDELLLKELVDDIAEGNLTGVYKLEISKKLTDFFYELAQRTGTFQDVFMGIRGNLNPEFLKKFADSTKRNIDFMRLVRITDKDFYEVLRDSPAKFEEVFQQKAEDFEKVRYALQIAAGDDYISRAETWMNRYFGLAYKLPATYFSGVTMVVLNAIQNTTEMLFKHMEGTWTGDSVGILRKKYGIVSDENLLTSIGGGRQGNLNGILSTDKRSKLGNNLMTNGAYSIVEDMASGTFMNKATAQAMTEMGFQNSEEFVKYMDNIDQFKKDEMIAIINDRAVKIFEQRTANSVNPTRGKFVFGKLQTYAGPSETTKGVAAYDKLLNAIVIPVATKSPEWVTSIPGRAWNILANTYMFMGTRGTRHIVNSFKLIASPVATKKLYFQLIEERGLATANKLIREYYNKNFDSLLLVNKIVSSIWIGARLDRLVDDGTDQDGFNFGDAREFGQMFYAPMQSIMSSPFGRAVFRFLNGVFIDKNHQDMDVNGINAGFMLLFKQVMNDLGRKFALPRAVVGAMNPASEENFFVGTRENLMGSTQGLMNMLSDDVIKQGFEFPVPISNASRLAGIMPGLDKRKQKYFDESTLMKLKMIEEGDAYTFKNWLLYSIPFIKDRKSSAFSDKNYQDIVNKLGNDPVYIKAIMEGKLPINGDLDYVSNIFSVMTQGSLSQSNTLFERGKNFEQKFLGGASFLNAKEQATTAMLLDYLSKGETEAFIKAFNETDNTKTKQGLHLLAFVQSMEGGKMGSPGTSSELIANIMQEQYYLWGNNFRKSNPAYKYNTATKTYPPLPEDVDTAFKAQLVADYSDLLYTIDKNKFADALMYYVRKASPEQASMFTELVPGEERKSVAFAKKSTEDVTYADGTFVPKGTVSGDYQANSVFKLDIFTKMQILNGDGDGYAMKNAFSTLYNPNSYQAKDPVYVSIALKSMNDNIAYIKESNMSEQDKTHMIAGMMLGALPMINELQKDKKLQDSVGTIYNDTMYRLMGNVNDGIELATEIGYRKLQDGKFKKSPTKTGTVLDNYSATGNYYGNYFSSNYTKSNSILSGLKSFLQSHPGISTSKFDKPAPVGYKSYIDAEKKLLELTSGLYFVGTLDALSGGKKFKREGIKLPSRAKSKGGGRGKGKGGTKRIRKPTKFFNTTGSK